MASMSPKGTWSNPSGMGTNAVCFSNCPVAARAASVRPWKASLVATTRNRSGPGPPAGQLDGALVGLGPRVGEEDLSTGPLGAPADQPVEGDRHLGPDRVAEQVGHVAERAGLGGDGVGHHRVGVAERGHGQPGEEVEVGTVLGVERVLPSPRTKVTAGSA